MEGFQKIKTDFANGSLDANQLLEIMASLFSKIHSLEIHFKIEIEKLKQQLENQNQSSPPSPSPKISLKDEEKRQANQNKKLSKKQQRNQAGRKATEEKWKSVDPKNIFEIFPKRLPQGVSLDDCKFSHKQVVLRLIDGKPVLCGYLVYQYKKIKGQIPEVLGRSEFGLEIAIEIGFLLCQAGNSFRQAIETMAFFRELQLTKSQIESLMNQLARHWESEFERLCTLLANSVIVHADETGWSLKSVWVFLSEQARVLLFGVNKDAKTLEKILDKAKFQGILICDDAAVYDGFTKVQRCWAHLLRKAIRHALLAPGNEALQEFKDQLIAIYQKAKRVQSDGRHSDAGRLEKVKELGKELMALCERSPVRDEPEEAGLEKEHWLLVEEIIRLYDHRELFTFVTAPKVTLPNGEAKTVGGTNNEAERTNIPIAEDRKNKKTSKSYWGCRRKSIITSVFGSLRLYLQKYTLKSVLTEIRNWWESGESCFARQLRKLRLKLPESEESVLDRVMPETVSS